MSKALQIKIEKMRAQAPMELPKVRASALAVLSSASPGMPKAADAIACLREVAGAAWGVGTAVQYLTGRQAEFAIACAPQDEQPHLHLARAIALQIMVDAPNGQQAKARVEVLGQTGGN